MDEDKKQETEKSKRILEAGKRNKEGLFGSVDQKKNAMAFYKYYLSPSVNFVMDTLLKSGREKTVKNSLYKGLEYQFIKNLLFVYQEVYQESEKDSALLIDKKVLEDNLYNYLDKIAFSDKGDFDLSFLDNNGRLYKDIKLLRKVKDHDDIDNLLIMVMVEPRLIRSEYVFDQMQRILLSAELRKQRDLIPRKDLDELPDIFTTGLFSPERTEKLISEIIKFFQSLRQGVPHRHKALPPDKVLADMVYYKSLENQKTGIRAYATAAIETIANKYGVADKTVRDIYYRKRKR
jgi:hypothetical protein